MNLIKNKIYDVMTWTLSDISHVKRNTFIQIFIATLAFIMLVRVFPMGLVQNHTMSKQKAFDVSASDELTGDAFTSNDKKLQTVYFDKEHIYSITLYLKCTIEDKSSKADSILFRLYNDNFSCIYEEEINCASIEKKGNLSACPDMDVEQGKPYYYEILVPEECKAGIMLPVADRTALSQRENSTLYIDGIINDDVSLIADFDYSKPLSAAGIIILYLMILAASAVIYILFSMAVYAFDERFYAYNEIIIKYLRIGVSVVAAASALALFVFSVILNKFGGEIWDRLFFAVGIFTALSWLMAALWFPYIYNNRKKQSKLSVKAKRSLIWRNYIQTVSFALLFYALCQYVNADRNYYHYINTRWMLIFLAIAFLMNYNERQIVNKMSAVWIVLGVIGSAVYCNGFTDDEKLLVIARLTCAVVVVWGLLIINILLTGMNLRNISIDKIKKYVSNNIQQTIYVTLWIVFCILMYIYRFEKVWVFTASLPFAALLFFKSSDGSKSRFIRNFTNGILLSFGLVTFYCMVHRPHHYWMLYRYGGIFHTVACTGMYLAVVFGAALSKLYGKVKTKKRMLTYCLTEYFVTACTVGFILLTMSRTAFLTTAVTLIAVVVLTAVSYHKSFKRVVAEIGILAVVCALSFPMVFTAVRMVPAVINDPVRYDIEFQDRHFMIYEGDPIDSDKYMTVRRFFDTFFGRFQTQASAKNNSIMTYESGTLAYMGNDFAGVYMYMASNESDGSDTDNTDEDDSDISNGRFEIFKSYIEAIGIKGHPKMGPENEKGEEYAHAHNSYLQVAYNFGIIAGGVFLVLCAFTLWRAIRLFYNQGSKFGIFLVPFALVIVFGFVSLTEWAFHPCIPAGFSFILMQAVLMKN